MTAEFCTFSQLLPNPIPDHHPPSLDFLGDYYSHHSGSLSLYYLYGCAFIDLVYLLCYQVVLILGHFRLVYQPNGMALFYTNYMHQQLIFILLVIEFNIGSGALI